MSHSEDEPMWCVVMFDLPVGSAEERRAANGFRHLLIDLGFWRVQYSVYALYTPRAGGSRRAVAAIRSGLPGGGEVRIMHITDHQWASALRFARAQPVEHREQPQQLTIF